MVSLLTRAFTLPDSPITHLFTAIMGRTNLLHRAVGNDARRNNANTRNRARAPSRAPAPAPTPAIRNTEDDEKLKTILPAFCKYHHDHIECPENLRNNRMFKRLLEEGLKMIPDEIYQDAQREEIYPKWFDDYCAGKCELVLGPLLFLCKSRQAKYDRRLT